MKFLGVYLILGYYILNVRCMSEEMQEIIDMLHNTCKEQSGVDEDTIKNAQKGDFAEDPKLKCYIKCIMTEMSTIDEAETGTVDVEAAVALLPPDIQESLGSAIKKCGTQSGADVCDTAFKTFKCYSVEAPKDFFLP